MPRSIGNTVNIYAAIVESSPDAIITADMDGRITSWNAAAEEIIGFSWPEVDGAAVASMVPAEDHDHAQNMLDRVRAGETIQEREVTRMRADGSTFAGTLTLAPIRAESGEICGTVGILRDISHEKSIAQFLRRNERLASIGTLSAGVAHEINNPIGGILMAAQYAISALERADSHDVVEKALADIEADAKRCAEIVRRLLRFANQERSERAECDVNEVVESAIRIAQRNVDDMATATVFEPVDDLPPVAMSQLEIEQVLVNLITNAFESRSTEVHIEVATNDDGGLLRIQVIDNGVGISEEVIDHLFDPFFTTKREAGAAGLGLSLAHAIVADHDGSLDVASCPEQGTTVTIDLPLSPLSSD